MSKERMYHAVANEVCDDGGEVIVKVPPDSLYARDAEYWPRRIAAALHATDNVDTVALEAGVVMVPVEEAREYIAARMSLMERIGSPVRGVKKTAMKRWATADERLRMTLEASLSRLQQNGGEPK